MPYPEVGLFLSTTRAGRLDEALATARELGFSVIQFGKLAASAYTPEGAERLARLLQKEGLTASGLCIVYDGESYKDVEAVRRTVGLVPAEFRRERVAYSLRCIDTAADLGIRLVTFHIGMLPAQSDEPNYKRVRLAVDTIAAYAIQRGITLGLETGQETAEELIAFLDQLETGVGVNFDGANFIAYSTADPLAALTSLYPYVVGVHIKDYAPPAAPGLLSRPAPLGQGAARVDETIAFLLKQGYTKPLILETYDPVDPRKTIADSHAYVLNRIRSLTTRESLSAGE